MGWAGGRIAQLYSNGAQKSMLVAGLNQGISSRVCSLVFKNVVTRMVNIMIFEMDCQNSGAVNIVNSIKMKQKTRNSGVEDLV